MCSGWPLRAEHVVRAVLDDEAGLGGEHDLVAAAGERAADELLVRERAVHVGGVEERDAELERAMDHRERLRVVTGAVGPAHPHAAESDRADRDAARAESPLLHGCSVPPLETSRVAALEHVVARDPRDQVVARASTAGMPAATAPGIARGAW